MIVVPKQGAEVPRLTLSQIMALSSDKGLLPVKVEGWVQGTSRLLPDCPRCDTRVRFDEEKQDYVCDACGLDEGIEKGKITNQIAQHNLVTREFFPMKWANDQSLSGLYILIGNDDTGVHEFKSMYESTMNGTHNSGLVSAVVNTVSEFFTYSHTFAAPASPRTIRQIGTGIAGVYVNASLKTQIVGTITELTSEVEQSSFETFEVVYKLQFSEVTP